MEKNQEYKLLGSLRELIGRTEGAEKAHFVKLAKQVQRAIDIKNVADMMTDGPIPGASEMEAAKMTSDIIALAKNKAANGPAV